MKHLPLPLKPRPFNRQSGFALVEPVLAMFLFSVGVLGLVALLGTMTKAQSASRFRAEASALSGELIGNLWSDSPTNRLSYASNTTTCTHVPCDRWLKKVATTLPKGSATIAIDATTGVTTIRISWALPENGVHTYVTSTSIF